MNNLVRTINRLVLFTTKHWLALVNLVLALILGLGALAPALMLCGQAGLGRLLYQAFRLGCHQLPERSFFLGGSRPWYSLAELSAHLGYEAPARFLGDAWLGYKVAYCERCTAMYAGWLLGGLAFAFLRRRAHPLPWQALVLLAMPMAVDGVLQVFGILESDWLRRTITGLLFGGGLAWFAFPFVEAGMDEAQELTQRSLEESDGICS